MVINTQKGCSFYREKSIDFDKYDLNTKPVENHNCDDLKKFNALHHEHECLPRIDEDGFIEACDDTNPIRINYCPFCGELINFGAKDA